MKKYKEIFGREAQPDIDLSLSEVSLKAQELAGKLSISGVQPKLSLKLNSRTYRLEVTARGGRYILKPQIQTFPNIPQNENLCMDIAAELDIQVPAHCLITLKDGSLAYVVKRFDRQGKDKIHQEDFYQILNKKDKYEGSVEGIGKRLTEISEVPGLDVQLLYERVVLNFLIGNGDAHLKNYSVIYDKEGSSRLSPAYDIVCSKIVIPQEEDSALTINGKRNKLELEDFTVLAQCFQIPEKIRFQKFAGKKDEIFQLIKKSLLTAEEKDKIQKLIQERYLRLKLK